MNPKVSILVPVYGVEKFIERCAVSLFEQTFESIEYIFVNDCTKDNSIEVLNSVISRYPLRKPFIRIINHVKNKGLAGARNTGIENALGDYILHVDSDDYIEVSMIEDMYLTAINDKSEVVICNYFLEWKNVFKLVELKGSECKNEVICNLLSGELAPSIWNKLILRDVYQRGDIKAIEGVNMGEDYLVTPRLVYYANKVSFLNKPLYHYIQYNSGSYTKKSNDKNIYDIERVLQELEFFYKNKPHNDDYMSALDYGKFYKKNDLLFSCSSESYNYVFELYRDIYDKIDSEKLSKNERILYYLFKKDLKLFVKFYFIFYKRLFDIIQKIKRRR